MFDNILVGVDGRQGGRDAIALAEQLAAPGASLTLAHVYGLLLGRSALEGLALERAEAHQLLERERDAVSVDATLIARGERPVGQGLHELADELAADLVVVGSCRRALLGRAMLGDDARAALDATPCAIAVAPRGYALSEQELHSLGVGYDGSPESERALDAARELARRHGATVKALWVVSLQDVREERPIPADWPQTAELLVGRCRDQLRRLDDVDGDAVYGGPREELQRLSDRVDLLLVGSRGYGPAGRLFHGSVSRYLLGHVACPLLVLPRSAAGPRAAEAVETRAQTAT
jgi:nucleotide-binding universal stress UspA family protein